jgi:hypothetical protein
MLIATSVTPRKNIVPEHDGTLPRRYCSLVLV